MLSLFLAAALCPQGPGTSTAPVVINEFSYDDGSTDNLEFVELYNRSGAPVDISGWSVINPDATGPTYGGTGATGVDQTYVIPASTILAPGASWLMGPATIAGVNQVIGVNNLFENDNEAIELRDANNVIVDSVAYELGQGAFGPHPLEGNGFYGDLAVGDGTAGPSSSIARRFDGYDNDDNGRDFSCCVVPTPGATNAIANALPYLETFDGGSTGAPVLAFSAGFVGANFVDPTSASSLNPSTKPASPQGGLAMATWDYTGGGNTVNLATAPVADVVVETWVYLQPIMAPFNPAPYSPTLPGVMANNYNYADGEWWAVGVRGTAAANGNPPDVGGYFSNVSGGVGIRNHFVTGIAWAHFRTVNFSQLYLIDFGNGAAPGNPNNYTILAGPIDIVPSVNDGWQRIRLHVQGDQVVGNFGGSFGFDDGQRFSATTATTAPGSIYVAYREAILYNNNGTAGCQPPIFDLFDAHAPTTLISYFGTGSPTSAGTPAIAPVGLPILGSTGFGIGGSSLVPAGSPNQGICVLFLGLLPIPQGYPIPGAPASVRGYLINDVSLLGFAGAGGTKSWLLPIPANNNLAGLTLNSQLFDFDLSLPAALPVGSSQAMAFTLGR